MNRSKFTRVLAMVLSIVMVAGLLPMTTFAADADASMSLTIASTKTSALAPGVQEQEVVAYDANGDRIVYYAIEANVATNSDVQVKANYHDNDNTGVWGKATVVEQANAAAEKRGYNVVASTNASYYNVSTGQPSGGFVMEGVNINGNSAGNSYPFFAVLKDGTAMIGEKGTFSNYADQIQEAVGGWTMLVWDGKNVATDKSKYPRSTVGVKANGDVVLMVADGNQKPVSAGLTKVEQAEVMISLGCVAAVELDGGGSATYAAKLEGTDEVVVRNSCCDGTVRSVSNTLMVISTAVADGTFHHANLSTEYAFYAPNSKVDITAFGADKGGYPAEIPENATWALSDDSFGTVADGVFTSTGKTGTVAVNMLVDDEVVGSIDVTLVHPTSIAFQAEEKMVPYSKPSDFTVDALYNGADMYATADAYNFVCTAGSMNGFIYTAPADTVTEATVTASYKYDSSVPSDVIKVTFGKGSELLFDFEDGIDEWGTYFDLVEAAEKGEYTNGYSVNYQSVGATTGNLVENGVHEDVFLATKENGKVHSGDYALGYTLDYRYSQNHANWQYAYLYYWGEPIVLRDTANGIAGTRLGMWMYIPEEAVGSCARLAYNYKDNTTGKLNVAYLYMTYQYVEKGFSKLTSDKIPEAGWAYVTVDMNQISNSYVSTSYYKDADGNLVREANSNYAPAFIQFIVSSSATGAEKCTFYIDDISLDYSDAVDDRDVPVISNPLILEDQTSYAIDGRTLSYNTITVTADAAEDTAHGTNYTGLDADTAQVYVDGHKVATKFAAGKISATGIVLPDGTHDITFEIADKQGNYTKLTKQIVIDAESDYASVTLTGEGISVNADGNLYTGGQYNMYLNTDKVEAIDTVNFKLWLNSASEWALENMTVLDGFKVDYKLDELACTADITVTRVDNDATGAAKLLTIPVYAWSWNEELGLQSGSYQWNNHGCAPQVTVSYKVKYSEVTYTDDYKVTDANYVPGFSNKRVDAKTELNSSIANLKKTIGEWHYHTEAAVADVPNTCTTAGFEGRTECSTCHAILDWGTTLPAKGHNYVDVDGVLTCDGCGDLFNGEKDGKTYIDGVIVADGWYEDTYYFIDGVKVTGPYVIDGKVYVFGDDGVYQPDGMFSGFIDTADGKMYFLSNTSYITGYSYISNTPYYFDENGIARDGEYVLNGETCYFEDGVYVDCSTADLYMAGWAGENAHFVFYKDGRFVFSGEGDMFYHQSNATIPWAKQRANITSIFVGKDITDIAQFAFSHAYYVEELVFEEGSKLETIGYQSFHYLNKLETLVLPESVKTIGWCAFGYWTSLETVYMPDNISSINKDAFLKHDADLVLQVAEGTYAEEYADTYGFKKEVRKLPVKPLGEGKCGENVSWILHDTGVLEISGTGDMADYTYHKYGETAAPWTMYRNSIKKVVIGEGIESIGNYAFYSCPNLKEVAFAENGVLKEIGEGAFGYCGLETITLPATVEVLGKNAFYYNDSLKTVDFEADSKLTTIGNYAFRNCTSLESVYIPDGVTKIGSVVLYQANADAVLSVADETYAETYAVKAGYKYVTREYVAKPLYTGTCGDTATWTLYDTGVLEIAGTGDMADYTYHKYGETAAPWTMYRNSIKKVVIGEGIESIGNYAFYSCPNLKEVAFAENGVLKEIGEGAFGYCGLETITLPATVEVLGKNAFYYNDSLKTVDFEADSKLTTIGNYAFRNCTSLESVYIPDGVTKIGSVILYQANANTVLSVAAGSYAESYATGCGYAVTVR